MTVRTVPIFIEGNTHPAEEVRLSHSALLGSSSASFSGGVSASDRAHGVVNSGDFAVSQRAAGANMSVDVAGGHAWVRGTENQHQGAYHVYNDGTVNLSVAAADATNPRLDLVVVRVQDAFYSGVTKTASLTIVTGTPAASPAYPTLPANALVLAAIRVAATASSIGTANITDLRTRAASGSEGYTRTGFKNQIMNGDFRINQRGLNSSGQVGGVALTTGQYGYDRWQLNFSGGTVTCKAQTFVDSPTAGFGRITGHEAQNYARVSVSGQSAAGNFARLTQTIEDVRTFADATVTVSFYARATTSALSAPAKMAVDFVQYFGTGGSPNADVSTPAGQVTLTTSWARYSLTVALPSIANRTIGTTANTSGLRLNLWASAGSTYNTPTGTLGTQTNDFDVWGVQVERGSFPTAFEERPLQTELALCQRYYVRKVAGTAAGHIGAGWSYHTTLANIYVPLQVPMRVTPTALDNGGSIFVQQFSNNTYAISALSLLAGECSNTHAALSVTHAAGSANIGALVRANNDATGYVGFTAEF